ACGSGFSGSAMRFQDFVDEEQVGEKGAQVNGSVQVVDQLRADRSLGQHEAKRRLRVPAVAVEDAEEVAVRRSRFDVQALDKTVEEFGQTGQRRVASTQILTDLGSRGASFLARQALGGVRQHELVAFLDGIAAVVELGPRLCGRSSRDLLGPGW